MQRVDLSSKSEKNLEDHNLYFIHQRLNRLFPTYRSLHISMTGYIPRAVQLICCPNCTYVSVFEKTTLFKTTCWIYSVKGSLNRSMWKVRRKTWVNSIHLKPGGPKMSQNNLLKINHYSLKNNRLNFTHQRIYWNFSTSRKSLLISNSKYLPCTGYLVSSKCQKPPIRKSLLKNHTHFLPNRHAAFLPSRYQQTVCYFLRLIGDKNVQLSSMQKNLPGSANKNHLYWKSNSILCETNDWNLYHDISTGIFWKVKNLASIVRHFVKETWYARNVNKCTYLWLCVKVNSI